MWIWDQSAGELSRDGKLISRGYAGNGRGKNNPTLQAAQDVGPIPAGMWTVAALRLVGASTGPFTLVLVPQPGTNTFGRSEFRIHGDSIKSPGTASHGCIILPLTIRRLVWASNDRDLKVVT